MSIRPRRSLLFSPAANARALEKAKTLNPDGYIFDLEDSAAEAEKAVARERIVAALGDSGYGRRERIVRINGLDTPLARDDLFAAVRAGADGILVPKVSSAGDILAAARMIADAGGAGRTQLWAMLETARALLDVAAIAQAAAQPECNCAGFVLGTNDIARETRVAMVAGRGPMLSWISQCVLAARAHGLIMIDSVYNDFRDATGFHAECEQGLQLGMDGKSLIHPAQIDTANAVFAPSNEAVAQAERIVAAFGLPENQGKGVISIDGRMVELLHARMAKETLQMARAIRDLS